MKKKHLYPLLKDNNERSHYSLNFLLAQLHGIDNNEKISLPDLKSLKHNNDDYIPDFFYKKISTIV